MTEVSRSIVIDAPREEVFDVVTDFESYPEFLPEMKEVNLEKGSAKEAVTSFKLQLLKTIKYRLKLKLTRPSSVSWTLLDGEMMKKNTGSWKLKKLSAKKTEAKYSIDIELGGFVPKAVTDRLVSGSLPAMLENFKKRIEE